MTDMEHAIEHAAQAIRRTREFQAGAAFGVPEDAYEAYTLGIARALAAAGLLHDPLPTPADGCQCTGHSQDYGGYVEFLLEYEPSCPEHSEHVWNPRTGMWEHAADRAEGDGSAVR